MTRINTEEYCIIPVRFSIDERSGFLNFLQETGKRYGVTIVCLNREMIAGSSHVETTLKHASRAWNEGKNIARSLEIEVLLYAAGSRQTGKIGPFGPKVGNNDCYLCIIPPLGEVVTTLLSRMEEVKNEDWNEMTEDKKNRLIHFFSITPEELEVSGEEKIIDLICERSSLLTVYK